MKIKIGDKIPNEKVFTFDNNKPVEIKIGKFLENQKVILFGLPGAFTSMCSSKHLPGYVELHDQFKNKGIDKLICISVNDPFVMNAWGKINNVQDKIIMISDPFLNFTNSIGATIDKTSRGLGFRSNRYVMLINDLTLVMIEEEKDTAICEISSADNFLNLI